MSFPDFKPTTGFTLDGYVLLETHSKRSPSMSNDHLLASSSTASAWAGLTLHPNPRGPQSLHRHMISSILQVHHLELVLPSGCGSTIALMAGLVTVAAGLPMSLPSIGTTQPAVLLLCLSSQRAERGGVHLTTLARGVPGAEPHVTHDGTLLSEDLKTLTSGSEKPARVIVATLSRAAVLRDHRALLVDHQLAVLTLDLRPCSLCPITHHAITQVRNLLELVGPYTQLIVLLPNGGPRPSSALATLLSVAMDRSIRFNLGNSPIPSQQETPSTDRLPGVPQSTLETSATVTTMGSGQDSPVPEWAGLVSEHWSPNTSDDITPSLYSHQITDGLGLKSTRPIPGQLDQLLQLHQDRQEHIGQWNEIIKRFERAGLTPADFATVEHKRV
ncbi:hypothetical protein CROQUDRAFT_132161 [Cronartium quercuum f. sp. fusiforme G11]|uniref:Uncharacterized protein n=1 Tax=Cronartium quercuum f. sp. fusiforme G11 TaxID=708437 RepID=A0A9P6NPR0_9BASI|nr:hypothetical protein CROQUDRAFT_132161 [Cronartium quercuum f. sp. fusiforme G11]